MILNRIYQLAARIRNSSSIPDVRKAELLGLLDSMKEEASTLDANAASHTGHEADDQRPIETVFGEIQDSLTGMEASHPRLTQLANQIAVALSNMGI